jgi:hypothetical protein
VKLILRVSDPIIEESIIKYLVAFFGFAWRLPGLTAGASSLSVQRVNGARCSSARLLPFRSDSPLVALRCRLLLLANPSDHALACL